MPFPSRFNISTVLGIPGAPGAPGPQGPPGSGAAAPLFVAILLTTAGSGRQVIFLDGYAAVGDGGGGLFAWDAASTATPDGGTIFQVTGVVTGRWKRIYNGQIIPEFYGAKGDGTTDDLAAFTLMIAAKDAGVCDVIALRRKKYRLSAAWDLGNLSCSVRGSGWTCQTAEFFAGANWYNGNDGHAGSSLLYFPNPGNGIVFSGSNKTANLSNFALLGVPGTNGVGTGIVSGICSTGTGYQVNRLHLDNISISNFSVGLDTGGDEISYHGLIQIQGCGIAHRWGLAGNTTQTFGKMHYKNCVIGMDVTGTIQTTINQTVLEQCSRPATFWGTIGLTVGKIYEEYSGTVQFKSASCRNVTCYKYQGFCPQTLNGHWYMRVLDGTSGVSDPTFPVSPPLPCTAAVNNGSGLFRLTVTGHGRTTGDKVYTYGFATAAGFNSTIHDAVFTVTVIDANTLDLQGSTYAALNGLTVLGSVQYAAVDGTSAIVDMGPGGNNLSGGTQGNLGAVFVWDTTRRGYATTPILNEVSCGNAVILYAIGSGSCGLQGANWGNTISVPANFTGTIVGCTGVTSNASAQTMSIAGIVPGGAPATNNLTGLAIANQGAAPANGLAFQNAAGNGGLVQMAYCNSSNQIVMGVASMAGAIQPVSWVYDVANGGSHGWRINGALTIGLISNLFGPSYDNTIDLGTSSVRWRTLYAVNVTAATMGGVSGVPMAFSNSAVTLAATGTTTLSAAQQGTPNLTANTVTLTGNITIDFGGIIGDYELDLSAATLGAFTVTLKNGAGTKLLTTILAAKGASSLITVSCRTAATVNAG